MFLRKKRAQKYKHLQRNFTIYKNIKTAIFAAFLITGSYCNAAMEQYFDDDYEGIIDVTDQIPVIKLKADRSDSYWEYIPDVAHYKCADWSSCVGIAHNVSRESAKKYAGENSNITFFFFVKGAVIILDNLEASPPLIRYFYQNDAVFFSGDQKKTICWGSAAGYADGYVKRDQ
ncbi:MAG: hypothetical protein H0W50_01255 [Parachlamydiaceae bacterium]|nr:hypothetical protein [Parachlamydiaceae bacterium]